MPAPRTAGYTAGEFLASGHFSRNDDFMQVVPYLYLIHRSLARRIGEDLRAR